ncbi:hypothetical protein QYM36_012753 [Artemia franciscana]|uniref:Mon2 C-terminal domain-containing protein n=1 Tax=Artemia franciscana TaxID=6661 RepID=A0AA88HVR8_ARTSF|nr:hypothetical protein QYM36_012753 [Artemia franciscana]
MASEKDVLDTSTGKPLVAADQNGQNAVEDFVDPWNVHTSSMKGVDYDKLINSLFGVLNNIISVPVHCDASPFVLPPITENVLTPLQEGILCFIDCIQVLFFLSTDCGVVQPNADDSADCKIILLLKEDILKNPTSFPPHFLLSPTKLLNRGSVQSLAFDCGNSVRIREGFAKICFETLLQLSLNGLADFNFSNGDSESQQNHPKGEAANGEDETVANRLAVTALLHRFQDVLKRYVHDVKLGGTCPLPTHRVVEATFVLQAVSTLGRSLQDAELDKGANSYLKYNSGGCFSDLIIFTDNAD